MKLRNLVLSSVMLCFLMSILAVGGMAADSKVGIIDLNQVIQSSAVGKQANAMLAKFIEDRQSKLNDIANKIETLRAELNSKLSDAERKNKQADLDKANETLNQEKNTVQNEINQKIQELRQPILVDIGKILNIIAASDGFTTFLDINSVVYFDKSTDVTWEVIRKYDTAYQAAIDSSSKAVQPTQAGSQTPVKP